MKKDKVISDKKTIKNSIKLSLITELKALAGKFGAVSEKLEKDIVQSAKKLAKAIAKENKTEESAQTEQTPAPVAKTEPAKKAEKAEKVTPEKKVATKVAKPVVKKEKPAAV